MREQQHLAAAADELERFINGGIGGNGDDSGVQGKCGMRNAECGIALTRSATTLSHLMEEGRVKRPFRAEFFGELQARFQQVGGEDARAGELQQAREHQANRPLPGHQHDVAAQQVQAA